ncbi:hypothetical protein HY639_04850 [Candidatus Woesearchaeota archaeon]|nr:hypothetical protein [Candidatus Woesearchaeota archaeon]
MGVLGKLFSRKASVADLEKLEIPELPSLPALKKKGKKALPAYPAYVTADKHTADMERLTKALDEMRRDTAKGLRKDMDTALADLARLRKDVDIFKKMKLVDATKGRDNGALQDIQNEVAELRKLWDEVDELRAELKTSTKKSASKEMKDLQEQLAEQEAQLALLSEQVRDTDKLKEEVLSAVQTKIVEAVFESRYDPKQLKAMKKDVMAFINRAIEAGHSQDKVRKALIEKGWPDQLIETYVDSVYTSKLE